MKIVLDIRQQLVELCERLGVASTSEDADCSQNLRKAMLSGLFVNVAEHAEEGKYRTVSDVWVKEEGGREEWIRNVPYGVWRALRNGGNPPKVPLSSFSLHQPFIFVMLKCGYNIHKKLINVKKLHII